MTKLTGKQRRRWGAMQNALYEKRPLALKDILESEEPQPLDELEDVEQLDFDADMEIEED